MWDRHASPVPAAGRKPTSQSFEIDSPRFTKAAQPERYSTPDMAKKYGSLLEVYPYFPNRTNVQFMKVLARNNIQLEIWERGAGYTLASGSSKQCSSGCRSSFRFVRFINHGSYAGRANCHRDGSLWIPGIWSKGGNEKGIIPILTSFFNFSYRDHPCAD